MATTSTPRPQPYHLDWSATDDLDTLNAQLGTFWTETDDMFRTLFEDLASNLDGLTLDASDITGGKALTEFNDTNVTLTLGGSPLAALLAAVSITVGWTGTLAAGRLNANVVQAVVNDTNVTGVIAAQTITLGWTGTLSVARGGTGTASPGLIAGTNITITGSWPNQTINSTASGGLSAKQIQTYVSFKIY